jgi:hypothetical protein
LSCAEGLDGGDIDYDFGHYLAGACIRTNLSVTISATMPKAFEPGVHDIQKRARIWPDEVHVGDADFGLVEA